MDKNAYNRAYYKRKGHLKRREYNLKANYGITVADYDRMVEDQDGGCAICRGPPGGSAGRFHVDHDHATGIIRGLLCYTCNIGLGSFHDDPAKLRGAIHYLTCRI